MRRESAVRIVVVHPDLLGTYGDGGNAVVLAQRLRWRGYGAEIIEVPASQTVPASGDIYCLGGGEDGPQATSAGLLIEQQSLKKAVGEGAAVLAVCAGFQVVGNAFPSASGERLAGVGLLDVETFRGTGPRAVGEVVSEPLAKMGLPALSGFENHGGVTRLGAGVTPLGQLRSGVGNGCGDRSEGALSGRVLGTYLHGPVLARNPRLADLLASWVVGPLAPLDDTEAEALRSERILATLKAGRRRGLLGFSPLEPSRR